jgi:hypothetical protein
MKYGLAREGKDLKDYEYQWKKLEEYGAEKIFVDIDGETLPMILEKANERDEIIVTNIRVFNDNIFEMLNDVAKIADKKVRLVILNQ